MAESGAGSGDEREDDDLPEDDLEPISREALKKDAQSARAVRTNRRRKGRR